MFTFAGFVVALCAWFAGLGIVEIADLMGGAARRRRCTLERHGTAILVGLALLPAIYAIAATRTVGPLEHSTGSWIALGPGLAGLLLWLRGVFVRSRSGELHLDVVATRSAYDEWRAHWSKGGMRRASAVAVATGVALSLYFGLFAIFFAGSLPVHLFDSIFHFAYKGKVLFAEGFGGPGWMIRDPELHLGAGIGRIMTHPNYPPGVPALHCLVASRLGEFSEDATRPLMALFAVGGAALMWVWLVPRSLGAAAAGTLAWISLPFLYYSRTWYGLIGSAPKKGEVDFFESLTFEPLDIARSMVASWMGQRTDFTAGAAGPDGWTLDGAADLPQAVLFCVGVVFAWRCLRWSSERCDRGDALIAGILLGGSALVKNEGLALLGIAMAIMGGYWLLGLVRTNPLGDPSKSHRRSLLDGALILAIAVVMVAPWLSIRGAIPSIDEDYPAAIRLALGLEEPSRNTPDVQPRSVGEALARVPTVLGGFFATFIHVLRWNLVWIVFIAALAMWLVARARRLWLHPFAPLVAAILGTSGAYGLILVVTPWDLALLYSTAIPDRLLLHVVPLVILCTTALIWRRADEWGEVNAPADPAIEAPADPTERGQ